MFSKSEGSKNQTRHFCSFLPPTLTLPPSYPPPSLPTHSSSHPYIPSTLRFLKMTNAIASLYDAVASILHSLLLTVEAILSTIYSLLAHLVTAAWSVVSGVLKTTFNVTEATLEGIAKSFAAVVEGIWDNKLLVGIVTLGAVIYINQTTRKTVGTGRKPKTA
ncbi:hypothetical protein BDY24DRAFT_373008 [Mrakia frigida]|uniref:uncharacterized protein n=1 Tax=Mrakia frigida TaxID=29902 RepID=UPI003FCC195D